MSNPDVSLGWYGVPYDRPLARTEEYLTVVRLALSGQPVRFAGQHFRLGDREPARLLDRGLPIYLAAVGPANLELAGRIADGWIGVFTSPARLADSLRHVEKGRDGGLAGFEVLPSVPIAVGDDVAAAADQVRGYFQTPSAWAAVPEASTTGWSATSASAMPPMRSAPACARATGPAQRRRCRSS